MCRRPLVVSLVNIFFSCWGADAESRGPVSYDQPPGHASSNADPTGSTDTADRSSRPHAQVCVNRHMYTHCIFFYGNIISTCTFCFFLSLKFRLSLVPGGIPGIPAGGGGMPTENPAPSPSSPGTNTTQQQLMQQMLQMFAGGGGGGSATVRNYSCTGIACLRPTWRFHSFLSCRLRPQRFVSRPNWTSWMLWVSSTARPTCRPSLLLEETSMPL